MYVCGKGRRGNQHDQNKDFLGLRKCGCPASIHQRLANRKCHHSNTVGPFLLRSGLVKDEITAGMDKRM